MKWTEPKLEKLDEQKFAFGDCTYGNAQPGNCYNGTVPNLGTGGDCGNGVSANPTCGSGNGVTP
jgi:hypothetical protein